MNYADRLTKLGLETLELRRLHCDLILTYKILIRQLSMQHDLLLRSNSDSITRSLPFKLFVPRCDCDERKTFFSRVIHPCNDLELNAINFCSLKSSKSFIPTCNFNQYLHVFYGNEITFYCSFVP